MKKIISLILVVCYLVLFTPKVLGETTDYTPEEKPEVSSNYIYMYDLETKQVLWDKGSTERIFPASLTKMMTLIVALENIKDVDQTVLITEDTLKGLKEERASRAGFDVGDEPRIIDLLYGIMLPSGADCTNAIAYYVSGSLEGYVELMNKKAKELGMDDTNFVNVTGLHNVDHYSTLKDISKLLEYCLKNDVFVKIYETDEFTSIPVLSNKDGLKMVSTVKKYINKPSPTNKYNVNINGFLGGKSGYTNPARYCLASTTQYNGGTYVLITADSWIERVIPSNILDAGAIYNYYLDHYEKKTIYKKDELIKEVKFKYNFFDKSIDFKANEDITMVVPNDKNLHIEVNLPDEMLETVNKGDKLGTLKIYSFDNLLYEEELIAEKTIKKSIVAYVLISTYLFVIKYPIPIIISILLIIVLILIYKLMYEIKINKRKLKKRK